MMQHTALKPAQAGAQRSIAGRRSLNVSAQNSAQASTTVSTGVAVGVTAWGAASVRGTVRKQNEDRYDVKVSPASSAIKGDPFVFAGVYDGHGGSATAEWLQSKLADIVSAEWDSSFRKQSAITEAYLAADRKLLKGSGFMGMGERGVGGSKCGATAANIIMYMDARTGATQLLASNVGDARTVLVRMEGDGSASAVQLSVDHVPDREEERERIEGQNPNPRLPLVRYQGGTWRVGGLLALSRAFGDAYLKGSLQFEGVQAGSDGYSSGFGLIAEPYTTLQPLTAADRWLVVASDGLFAEEERGGGGGLDNATLAELLGSCTTRDCDEIAQTLIQTAVAMGSTDDVTVVVMRLGAEGQ